MSLFRHIYKIILYTFVVLALCVIGLGFYIYKTNFLALNVGEENKVFLVKKGDHLKRISANLQFEGIYEYSFISHAALRLLIGKTPVHAGEYELVKGDTLITLATKIKDKILYYRKITFVEGETIALYKSQIDAAYGLDGTITEPVKEGYFMPGTYNYLYGETKDSIMKRANKDMLDFVQTQWDGVPQKQDFYLKNIHEVLTLASVVERESGIGVERKLIAGVFKNRLLRGMKLQSDPTTVYELTKGLYKLDRPLTFNDLKTPGMYNTYYIKALPVAPIASPSKEAIIAVLNPEETDSLFFVATGEGGHNFATNFDDHKENIKKYKETLKNNQNAAKE